MLDGFYQTRVSGPYGESIGVLLINGRTFNGGDDYMVYRGTLGEGAEAGVRARVYRKGDPNSGKVFDLKAKFVSGVNGFSAAGFYPDGAPFSINAEFIAGPEL